MAPDVQRSAFPHRFLGIALLVGGIIMLAIGVGVGLYCTVRILGICVDYPYAGIGDLLDIGGIALLIVGTVLMVLPAASVLAPTPIVYPSPPGQYSPPGNLVPPPPSYAMPSTMRPDRYCSACGLGTSMSASFCPRCGKPLSPVS